MPVFNAGPALNQAIASFLAQSMTDFELIVVDDGSTDGCTDLVEQQLDPRIRFTRNGTNLGAPGSRNRAIALATGDYLAVADADDMADPLRLELQCRLLDGSPDVGVVAGASRAFSKGGPPTDPSIPLTTHAALTIGLRYGPSFYHGSVMVRRSAVEAVGGYRDVPATEDYDLYSRLLEAGHRFAAVSDVVLLYRRHDQGVFSSRRAIAARVHHETSERLRRNVAVPGLRDLVVSARSEPRDGRGEPRLRYLKLLGRTAIEHFRSRPAIAARCVVAALAVGPATWLRLITSTLRGES